MKVLIVETAFVACLLGFGIRAQAQGAPAEHSMTGCLAKGDDAGTFKLTDLEKGPKEVVIAETTANLAPHLGHKGRTYRRSAKRALVQVGLRPGMQPEAIPA